MNRVSLRIRIFLSMLLLVGVASVFIALVTIKQYKKQTKAYYQSRFERKETAAQKSINFELGSSYYPHRQFFLATIFSERIKDIALVHRMKMTIYDLNGISQINSYDPLSSFFKVKMPNQILKSLKKNDTYKESVDLESGKISQFSYSYIYDVRNGETYTGRENKVGVLKIEYIQDNSQEKKDLSSFLNRLFLVYGVMLLLAVVFAYFLSSYITRSLKSISDKIQETKLLKKNQKIDTKDTTPEIASIVDAYNLMIDELVESAEKLAKSEREQAWREMAKQVAHEIKNPLTPMKLTVQSFERKFDPNAEGIREKVKEYSETLTQQIDVMSSIATSFSDFARMPQKNVERIELVRTIKSAIDIFYENEVEFYTANEEIFINIDKNQITRVINNLVKNAIQATEDVQSPKIKVELKENNDEILLSVKDNGKGILKEDKEHIFEPKFTTKTSGMGLGLPMVKNIIETYNGKLEFSSISGYGTEFNITLPK